MKEDFLSQRKFMVISVSININEHFAQWLPVKRV